MGADRKQEAEHDPDRRHSPRRDVLSPEEAERVADVFTKHQRFVEAVARRHAPGPDHVPDIVQAVGVQICRGLNGFREEADIKTWLYRVTVNTSHDYYRSQQRQQGRTVEALLATPLPDQVLDPDDLVVSGERSQALYDAVQRLRPQHRDVMMSILDESNVKVSRPSRRTKTKGRRQVTHKTRQRWARKAHNELRHLLADDPRLDD